MTIDVGDRQFTVPVADVEKANLVLREVLLVAPQQAELTRARKDENTMQPNLTMVLEQVGKDKGIEVKILLQTLEQAILTAAKKVFGLHRELEAQYNEQIGAVDLFQICYVVPGPELGGAEAAPGREITKAAAEANGLEAELGDELLFQIFYREEDAHRAAEQEEKYANLLDLRDTVKQFGRIAAQTAKQVIIQGTRNAERENIFNEYKDRKGEIITGIVRRFERGSTCIVEIGRHEAILAGCASRCPASRTAPVTASQTHCVPTSRRTPADRRSFYRASAQKGPSRNCLSRRSPKFTKKSCALNRRPVSRARAPRSPSPAVTATSIRSAPAWA